MNDIGSVWLFDSHQVLVFDHYGEQVPELQGDADLERLNRIRSASHPGTRWYGFDEAGPLPWRAIRVDGTGRYIPVPADPTGADRDQGA